MSDDLPIESDAAPVQVRRPHVAFNLPVVATGIAGACQLMTGQSSRNYAAAVDRYTQIAVAALFIVSACLVIAGWLGNRSECAVRRDRALRVKACGLVGWSVGMMSYLVANWDIQETATAYFTSPANWIVAALIPPTLHRAWTLLRPVRASES